MKKMIFILFAVLMSVAAMSQVNDSSDPFVIWGGDSPFPHGVVMDFPWESVEGCWQSTVNPRLKVQVSKFDVEGQKLVELNINNGSERAVGLGTIRNNIVSAFMSSVSVTGDRTIFLAHLGRYCLAETEGATCREAVGVSMVREKDGVSTQEDHVLEHLTSLEACSK